MLRSPNAGRNLHFQHFLSLKAEKCKKRNLIQNLAKKQLICIKTGYQIMAYNQLLPNKQGQVISIEIMIFAYLHIKHIWNGPYLGPFQIPQTQASQMADQLRGIRFIVIKYVCMSSTK